MKKLIVTFLAAFCLFSVPAQIAFADETTDKETQELKTPQINEVTTLEEATFDIDIISLDGGDQEKNYFDGQYPPIINLILSVISFFVRIMGSIAVLLLIIAGFMLIFAQGNQQQIDSAKETIKYAIIGLVVTFLSYTVIVAIQSIFNAA